MSEQTEGQIVIDATAAEIMDVLTDFEAYPDWADVKSARVLERGEGGLGTKVAFEVDVPLLGKASYTLAYRYAPADGGMVCVLCSNTYPPGTRYCPLDGSPLPA